MAKKTAAFRSAITGKYVSASYANKHPKTTVKETKKLKSSFLNS